MRRRPDQPREVARSVDLSKRTGAFAERNAANRIYATGGGGRAAWGFSGCGGWGVGVRTGATNNGRTGVQFLDSLRMKTSQMLIAFGALLLAVAWVISGGAGSAVEEVYTRWSGHSNDSTLPADPSNCQSGRGRPPFSAQVPLLPKPCPDYIRPQW